MTRQLAEIQRILLREWDPIGVQDFPNASDEYDDYALHIFAAMRAPTPTPVYEIAAYLGSIQSELMGMEATSELNDEVAAMIVRSQGM